MQKFYGSQGGAPGGGAPGGFPGAGGDAGAKTDDGPSVESAPLLHLTNTADNSGRSTNYLARTLCISKNRSYWIYHVSCIHKAGLSHQFEAYLLLNHEKILSILWSRVSEKSYSFSELHARPYTFIIYYTCHHRLLNPNNHPILIPPPTEDERPLSELVSEPGKKEILVNY